MEGTGLSAETPKAVTYARGRKTAESRPPLTMSQAVQRSRPPQNHWSSVTGDYLDKEPYCLEEVSAWTVFFATSHCEERPKCVLLILQAMELLNICSLRASFIIIFAFSYFSLASIDLAFT